MAGMNDPLLNISADVEAAYVPTAGDRYARCMDPLSGNELRCAVISISGGEAEVQFYDKEKDVPKGDPTKVSASGLKPMLYPDMGACFDMSAPVAKGTLVGTDPEVGLTAREVQQRTAKFGPNKLEEKKRNKLLELLKCFWGPMPIMIWIAMFVEILEEDWPDFGVLLALQLINGILGWYEDMKAGDAIEALKKSLKPRATCKRDGIWDGEFPAAQLVPGDIVQLGAGASVPADCELLGGPLQIDQAALTGESLPVTMKAGQVAKMGSTVMTGECDAVVYDHGPNTFFGKTASMIANVDEIGHFQKILLKITGFLMGVSCVLVSIAGALLLHRGSKPLDSVAFCVVLLVASIPIAMPVVSTATMALGSRALSAKGAIVTRLASIEEVAGMDMLCSDKTGTLTKNIMELQEDIPIFTDGVTKTDVLKYAAMAAKWKEPPKDALDTLVLKSFDPDVKGTPGAPPPKQLPFPRPKLSELLSPYEMLDHIPFNPTDKRTESTIKCPEGYFKVSKGAPHVILHMSHNQDEIHDAVESTVNGFAMRGVRCLSVARTKVSPKPIEEGEEVWEYLGIITFLDPPREDTAETIRRAREYFVEVKMITGDQVLIAKDMAKTIGLGQHILLSDGIPDLPADKKAPPDTGLKYGKLIEDTDGFAQVFPEHKFMIVEALKQRGWACGMTGDGVNDAPALKVANIGIAVEGATDAAQAASDIVLTEPGLSTIVDAIVLSRQIFQRLRNYVIYRIACTIQLLLFFFIGVVMIRVASKEYVGMSPGCQGVNDPIPNPIHLNAKGFDKDFGEKGFGDEGIADVDFLCNKQFELPVIAIVLITILNDGTIISIAYDTVVASPRPEHWRLPEVFIISSLLGIVAVASSIFLLYCGLTANASTDTEPSIFKKVGLVALPTGKDAFYHTDNSLAWQHKDGEAIQTFKHPCPPGGCTWEMCNPFVVDSLNGPATLKDGKIQPMQFPAKLDKHGKVQDATPEQLQWAQPTFCFSYNRTPTPPLYSTPIHSSPSPRQLIHLEHTGAVILLASSLTIFCVHVWLLSLLRTTEVQTMMYMKISLSDFMTVFAARTRKPFYSRAPGGLLLGAATFALGSSTLLSRYWPFPELKPLEWSLLGYVRLETLPSSTLLNPPPPPQPSSTLLNPPPPPPPPP
jgi:H+-transporting ATPase